MNAVITLITIIAMVFLLILTKVKMDVVFLLSMLVFMTTGILSEKQVFSSFVSNACLTVIFMSIIIAAMRKTGCLQWIMDKVLKKPTSPNKTLLKLTSMTALLSAFISNPTMGLIMFSAVSEWAKKHRLSPTKLLLPVSIAIGLGGSLLTIGKTGSMLWKELTESLVGQELEVTTPLMLGGIVLIVCFPFIFLFKERILDHADSLVSRNAQSDICAELVVTPDSDMIGRTLAETKCYFGEDFNVVSITTPNTETITDVAPDRVIHVNDRIVFSGRVDVILNLAKKHRLMTITQIEEKSNNSLMSRKLYQLGLVMPKSPLIGKKFSEISFEQEYRTMCISLYRNGFSPNSHPRNTILKEGDIVTFHGMKLPWDQLTDTLLPKESEYIENYDWHTVFSALVLMLSILASMLGVLSLVHATFIGVLAVGLSGCIGHKNSWNSIGWSTITVIAGAQSTGMALRESGLADILSERILSMCGTAPIVSLTLLVFISIFVTQFIFDNAAIALMLPIGVTTAMQLGTNPIPFAIAVLMACSANLCTGISTPYMSMVMIHGQYTNKEIFHYGWPFAIIQFATIVVATAVCYDLV